MRLDKIVWILLVSLFLTNCTATRSNVGATLGATTTTGACVSMGINDPYAIAACAVTGAFAGAEISNLVADIQATSKLIANDKGDNDK